MKKKISRYPIPKLEELPQDIQKILQGVKEHFGFIPNVMMALAHRPLELKAFLDYNNALKNRPDSNLTVAEKEMLVVAHSGYNGCQYCVQSHGANLRVASKNPQLADQVAINYKEADLTERERAICDFSLKITTDSKSINEDDFEALRKHGLNDEDIWDIAGIASFYNMSNRMMNFIALRPDDEFYMMGRK